ncbi:MAG: hypothetical protein EZS28_016317 [Streblomastix strix]|uniref:Uncharacterized protein n=1 Tax=Streblomastix strix TaxID=222440 RepID=A0A5J4W0X5_9EUKA|nr:MAG: hypothetical protein EZS28_016317 [Streblomastix strix]
MNLHFILFTDTFNSVSARHGVVHTLPIPVGNEASVTAVAAVEAQESMTAVAVVQTDIECPEHSTGPLHQ